MVNLYTIYDKFTTDHPGKMVMRRWEVSGNTENPVTTPCELVAKADTIEELRGKLPPNCRNLGRWQGEDPRIVESWMEQ